MPHPNQDIHDNQDEVEQARKEVPSGWLYLVQHEGARRMIDAFIDAGQREFNKSELARLAGLSWNTVDAHIELLVEVGFVDEVSHAETARYRFEPTSAVSQAIMQLDAAVQSALTEGGAEITDTADRDRLSELESEVDIETERESDTDFGGF